LIGRLLTYDALGMQFGEFRFQRRSDCAVCGDTPTITAPQDMAEVCSAEALADVRRLAAGELHALIKTKRVAIVDVREPAEFAVAHLPGAVNIPVGQIQARMADLPGAETLVFICRSGARSLTASALAARSGAVNLAHLEGGLLAWASEMDSS